MKLMKSKPTENQKKTRSEADSQDLQTAFVELRNWLFKILILLISAFWVLGLIIRLTVKDSAGLISTLVFYMSPLILLSLGAITIFLLSCWVRWYRIALIWLLLALMTSGWCWSTQFPKNHYHLSLHEKELPSLKVLFWNIGDRLWGMENVLTELRDVDADLIGMVEAGPASDKMKRIWKESFPNHPFQFVKNGFVLLSRVPISNQFSGTLTEMGKYEQLTVMLNQSSSKSMSVFLVDIKSNILKSRKAALEKLADQVAEIDNHPVLVLGDFNTPSDSVHFRPLRKSLRNAFESSGSGYMATWPLPVPVLDLDGVWMNDHCVPVTAENRWTWVSDHRPVVTQFYLKTLKKNKSAN